MSRHVRKLVLPVMVLLAVAGAAYLIGRFHAGAEAMKTGLRPEQAEFVDSETVGGR